MKILIFSSIAVVGVLLVAVQHQQLGQLRAENATLGQASAEADQLKADLAKSSGNEAQEAEEVNRLREENSDLLKLRNEVNQLRDAKGQFEKVSAENQRLQLLAKSAVKTDTKQSMQPMTIRIDSLFNRGLGTPEDAIQTFYWAQREQNSDALSRTLTPRSWNKDGWRNGWQGQNPNNYVSMEIVARRDVDATTVQLGLQFQEASSPERYDSFRQVTIPARQGGDVRKFIVTLVLQNGEWRVDATSR